MQTQTLVHADIFFFISSIGFIIVTLILSVGLVYMIGVLKSVRRITDKIEADIDKVGQETKELVEDLRDSTAFRLMFGGHKKRKNISQEENK